MKDYKIGDKIIFHTDYECYPHFIILKGFTGKIVENSVEMLGIKMDKKIEGCEYWKNIVHFYTDNEINPKDYIEMVK